MTFTARALWLLRVRWILAFIGAGAAVWGMPFLASADTANSHSVFYRLISRYQYGADTVDFDIVVGCGVRVTWYDDGDKSYDAFRDPVVFAKAMPDGSALWQIVPDACQGETTENGKVPDDFLPGVIWFASSKDLALGVGYFTEVAFSHPGERLSFLGASISSATREDWETFRPTALTNLVDSRKLVQILIPYSAEDIQAHKWDRAVLAKWLPDISCHLMARFELSEESARAVLHRYWPSNRPKYWIPDKDALTSIRSELKLFSKMIVENHPIADFFNFGQYNTLGFPTNARGGTLYSNHKSSLLPPTIFPFEAEDAVPWMTAEIEKSGVIIRRVSTAPENEGKAFCYFSMRNADRLMKETHFPNYAKRSFLMQVDGDEVARAGDDGRSPSAFGDIFFGEDRFLFLKEAFNLN